jgi:hypothetical protein
MIVIDCMRRIIYNWCFYFYLLVSIASLLLIVVVAVTEAGARGIADGFWTFFVFIRAILFLSPSQALNILTFLGF